MFWEKVPPACGRRLGVCLRWPARLRRGRQVEIRRFRTKPPRQASRRLSAWLRGKDLNLRLLGYENFAGVGVKREFPWKSGSLRGGFGRFMGRADAQSLDFRPTSRHVPGAAGRRDRRSPGSRRLSRARCPAGFDSALRW